MAWCGYDVDIVCFFNCIVIGLFYEISFVSGAGFTFNHCVFLITVQIKETL